MSIGTILLAALLQAAPQTPSPQPSRDTSARPAEPAPAPTARISGRVIADNGRALKRARVFINAAELPGGRGMLTDDAGAFDFTELPAGRYTLTASKSGFVSLSYGQRRPLQAGTPLQLNDGQQLRNVDFQLPSGSVIGGHVLDEDGEPMPGVAVRAMRYQYLQGDRRLTASGTGQTDDKGQFRIWGLMPGDYYVNATARTALPGGFDAGGRGGGGGRGNRGGGAGDAAAGGADENVNYAPTYYPGVASANDARSVTLGLSQELLDVNFSMQLVRMSRVTGRMTTSDGSPARGQVNLAMDGGASGGRGNQIGGSLGGRVLADGSFAITNVPPGRYLLRAFGGDQSAPQFTTLPVTVNGADVTDIAVVLTPGATISGTVTFASGSTPPPDPTQFRIIAPAADLGGSIGPQANARVDKDGRFTLTGVPAGAHLLRTGGNARGWTLKSVTSGTRDITDTPIELRSGETVSNVAMVFTDKVNEINGQVTGDHGAPSPDYTVLAFSTDPAHWRQQSRQIATTRPDQTGHYRIRTLPPGEYYVVTVDPAEQGEWFEPTYLDAHRAGASRVSISEGDTKTVDLRAVR
jgi:hypothetical protein